jgi:hypothetical protein
VQILISPAANLPALQAILSIPSVWSSAIVRSPFTRFAPNVIFALAAELSYAGDVILVDTSTDVPYKFMSVYASVPILTLVAPAADVPILIAESAAGVVRAPVPMFKIPVV